jgi:hypothetical protein
MEPDSGSVTCLWLSPKNESPWQGALALCIFPSIVEGYHGTVLQDREPDKE